MYFSEQHQEKKIEAMYLWYWSGRNSVLLYEENGNARYLSHRTPQALASLAHKAQVTKSLGQNRKIPYPLNRCWDKLFYNSYKYTRPTSQCFYNNQNCKAL